MKSDDAAPKNHRVWFLIFTAILAVGGLVYVYAQPELERNIKSWLTAAIILVALLLTVLWYILLSRLNIRARLITGLALVAAGFAIRATVRVDGAIDGGGLPRLAWKWTLHHEVSLQKPDNTLASSSNISVPPGVTDVPQFFGPHRDGIVRGANLVRDWSAAVPKQLWRQPIGTGWSAFAVVGGRAYTQEQRGDDELVTCYELLTGRLLWSHANHVHFNQWQSGDGSRATPTIEGGRVFTVGATGILNCLDATTGALIWSHDVLQEHKIPNITWGISDSPLVFDDRVVITGGNSLGPTLLAFHRDTGALLWKSGSQKVSYSSPVLATIAGRRVIVTLNAAALSIADAGSGAVLLEEPWKDDKMPKASQPVVLEGDRIFISAGYGYGCTMFQIKPKPDGKLTATELWANNKLKAQFNSVAVRNGHFYGLDDGSLACVEIETGTRKWKEGRFGSGQSLLVDDLVLIQSERGPVVLMEATPEGCRELGRIEALSSKTWNHPVLAGRYLLVRNDQEAACYELPVQ